MNKNNPRYHLRDGISKEPEKNTSDTPRTDDWAKTDPEITPNHINAYDFARTLERELTTAQQSAEGYKAEIERLQSVVASVMTSFDILSDRHKETVGEVERLRKEATDNLEAFNAGSKVAIDTIAQLTAENAKLVADKERLDWIDGMMSFDDETEVFGINDPVGNFRQRIDAARTGETSRERF